MNVASGLCWVLEPWAGEKPYLGTLEGVKTTVTLTLSFLPPFLFPILADEWTSSSGFSSLSLCRSCLFLISSGLSSKHHELPPHLRPFPPLYLEHGNISSAPPLFAITLYHSLHLSFFWCFLHASHLSHFLARFSPPFSSPSEHFSPLLSLLIFSFSFLLYHIFNIYQKRF